MREEMSQEQVEVKKKKDSQLEKMENWEGWTF